MRETWKSVVGYEGIYLVSDQGRVRREALYLNSSDRPLAPSMVSGYHRVTLCRDNAPKAFLVHRLVAGAFLGLPAGLTVNHKNGNKTDNRLANLEVVTYSQNEQHKIHVLKKVRRNRAKIDMSIAKQIRALYPQSSLSKLGRQFGLDKSTISDIVNRKTWVLPG